MLWRAMVVHGSWQRSARFRVGPTVVCERTMQIREKTARTISSFESIPQTTPSAPTASWI